MQRRLGQLGCLWASPPFGIQVVNGFPGPKRASFSLANGDIFSQLSADIDWLRNAMTLNDAAVVCALVLLNVIASHRC